MQNQQPARTYTIKPPSIYLGPVLMQNKEGCHWSQVQNLNPGAKYYKIGEAQMFLLIKSKILNKQIQTVEFYTKSKSYKCELKRESSKMTASYSIIKCDYR